MEKNSRYNSYKENKDCQCKYQKEMEENEFHIKYFVCMHTNSLTFLSGAEGNTIDDYFCEEPMAL